MRILDSRQGKYCLSGAGAGIGLTGFFNGIGVKDGVEVGVKTETVLGTKPSEGQRPVP